jgi:hypothetical protein
MTFTPENQTDVPLERDNDHVDRLLRAFFHSQLPAERPQMRLSHLVGASAAGALPGRQLVGSRLALVASLLIVLLCQIWLCNSLRNADAGALDRAVPTLEAKKPRVKRIMAERRDSLVPPRQTGRAVAPAK